MAKILSRLKQQPGTKGDDRPLLLIVSKSVAPLCHSFLYFSSLSTLSLSVLLARAAGRGPPSIAQRTAGRELPPAAEAREPPLAAAERAAAERASSWPRADRTAHSRPRAAAGRGGTRATAGCRGAGCRGVHEQLAAGRRRPCSARATAAVEGTGRHGARGRREELAAGRPPPTRSARARRHHKARSLQPRRAGRRRPLRRERSSSGRRAPREPSVSFFSYFLEIEMLIGLYGLYLVIDSLNDLLDLLILYGRFNIW